MTLIDKIRSAARKRAAYNRTVDELSRLPRDIALDIGIFREDARSIARKVVYGD